MLWLHAMGALVMQKIRTIGSKVGKCNICGKLDRLTDDHIPPRGVPNVGPASLHRLVDTMSSQPNKSAPRIFQSGILYRTLCDYCNSKLLGSEYDPSLVRFCKDVHKSSSINYYVPKTFDVKPNRLARCLIGHTLAHGVDQHGIGPVMDVLSQYVLDPASSFPPSYAAYIWIYPYAPQVVAKGVSQIFDYRIRQESSVFNILKFYPIGFLCADSPLPDTQVTRILRLDPFLSEDVDHVCQLTFNLSSHPLPRWPEAPGKHGCVFHHSDFSTLATPFET